MYNSFVALLLLGAALAQAVSYQALIEDQWRAFKLEHGKFYQSEEEEVYRKGVFMQNLHEITEHNQLYEMGLSSYKMGMNHIGDLTEDEFLKLYTIQMPHSPQYMSNSSDDGSIKRSFDDLLQELKDFVVYNPPSDVDVSDLADEIDWTKKGYVTPVKDQGQCGSCWSFSATGALEAQWFKKSGKLISLSEQNLVDCSWKNGNHGCNGGWMHWAFNYIKQNGGIDTEESYPYHAKNGQCHYQSSSKGAEVKSVQMLKGEADLQAKLNTVGPISVAAEVAHKFGRYHSGVYDEPQCGHRLNHAMLAVGYGTEDGKDYWLVKNSWGAGWGDQGYIKMSRNKNNQCGIADYPSYPEV